MDYKNYLEEITDLLWTTWDTKEIEHEEFKAIENKIKQIYEETNDPKCLWVLSEMYVQHINSVKRNGMKYVLDGLGKDYNNSGLHDNYVACDNGVQDDFKKRNHYKLIEYYYDFIKLHPDSLITRRILIENLIDNFRFDEANIEIEEAYKIAGSKLYLVEFYAGEILYKKGEHEKAIEFWKRICEKNKDNYISYFALGDEFAKFGRYDEAIEYYKLSFEMQKSPRKIDALQSLVQIYEIKKNYSEALNTINLILNVYENDYGVKDGEEIKPYLMDKDRIEKFV